MDNVAEAIASLKVPIDSVSLDPRNARKHTEPNLEAIKRSLTGFGQRKPIVVNRKTKHIEAGNGLWAAAKALGWTEIAVAFVDDSPDDAKAFGLMDNQSALLAEWDLPTLKDLLQDLDTGAFDMTLTGFSELQIESLMTQRIPETPQREPVLKSECLIEIRCLLSLRDMIVDALSDFEGRDDVEINIS